MSEDYYEGEPVTVPENLAELTTPHPHPQRHKAMEPQAVVVPLRRWWRTRWQIVLTTGLTHVKIGECDDPSHAHEIARRYNGGGK